MLHLLSQTPQKPTSGWRGLLAATALALLATAAGASAAYDIYWTKDELIYGSAADGSNPTVVFDGTGMAGRAIDVAVTETHIYWTDNGDPANPAESKIWRAERDGSGAEPLVQPSALFRAPQFLEIDEANNKIYFTCWFDGLFSANLDDGGNLALVSKPLSNHTGIVLRNPGEMLLITAAANDNVVYSIDLATGGSEQVFWPYGSHQTYGITIHPDSGLVYQTDHASSEKTIREMELPTYVQTELYTAANRPLGIDISPSGKYLVFVDGADLTAFNLETGNAYPLVRGLAAFGVAVAADPVVREDIVFFDDFESLTVGEELAEPYWPYVRQGAANGRATVTVTADEENLFRRGTSNQFLQTRQSGETAAHIAVTNHYAPGEGPNVFTFSIEFVEGNDSPFTDHSRYLIRAYSGTGTGTNLTQIDLRDLRREGLFEQNKLYRVDFVINSSSEPVEYSRDDGTGSWTLGAERAAIWIYEPATGPGDGPAPGFDDRTLSNPGSFTGFLLATFNGNTTVMNVDNIRVYNEAVVGRDLPEIDLPVGGFSSWQAAHFTAEELADETISGPEASPAGDGISNLMKYALGLDPREPSRDQLPQTGIVEGELALVFDRPAEIDDVEYVIEVSNDLVNWESGESFTTTDIVADTETGSETVTVKAIGYPDEHDRGFMRLRVIPE